MNDDPINIPSHVEWIESRISALLGAIVASWESKSSVCEEHLNELNEALEQNSWLH